MVKLDTMSHSPTSRPTVAKELEERPVRWRVGSPAEAKNPARSTEPGFTMDRSDT